MNTYDDLLSNVPAGEQSGRLSKEEYAAKKKAERDDIFALADSMAMEVAGDGAMLRRYLDTQAKFDRYSEVNALLILAQNPDATRVADFDHWKSLGASVNPGQTGLSILEPRAYVKEDGTPGTGYNVKKVFDISQVDTRKMKPPKPVPARDDRRLLKALISKAPVRITGVDDLPDGAGAVTDPDTGDIAVRKGMAFEDTFRSVARELAYADLTTGPDTQANPSFSAYCAAYLLCKKYGVDTNGFDFKDARGALADMDAREVKGELSQIRDAAEDISRRVARQLDAADKTARNQEAR